MAAPNKVEFIIGARDRTRAVFRRVRSGIRRLGASLLNFRTLATGIIAGAAIRGLTKYAEGLEAISDNAESLGLTTNELQGLAFAAREVGLSTADTITIFQRLNRRIGEALDGSPLMIKAFHDLGVTLDDLKTKTPAAIFDQLIDKSRDLSKAVADARIAKILDVEGLRFARLYKTEFESIADAVERAAAAGFLRNQGELDAAEALAESMRRFSDAVGRELAPKMLIISQQLERNLPTILAVLTEAITMLRFVGSLLAQLPRLGRFLGEKAFDFNQGLQAGTLTPGGRVLNSIVGNIQEIRDISARAERKPREPGFYVE